MGSGLIANLVAMAADAGVGMWTASPAIRLIGEERVEGVLVEREAGLCRIKAKAVVLATGAYDWSPELVETHEFIKDMYSLTPPTITGDHFKQIGRASCKERVCQYVEISVVAVSLKKKKQN